jgi:hypothetical protein
VTVPDQRTELVFIVQFRSKELELATSSFEKNWPLYPVLEKRTGTRPSSWKKNRFKELGTATGLIYIKHFNVFSI